MRDALVSLALGHLREMRRGWALLLVFSFAFLGYAIMPHIYSPSDNLNGSSASEKGEKFKNKILNQKMNKCLFDAIISWVSPLGKDCFQIRTLIFEHSAWKTNLEYLNILQLGIRTALRILVAWCFRSNPILLKIYISYSQIVSHKLLIFSLKISVPKSIWLKWI